MKTPRITFKKHDYVKTGLGGSEFVTIVESAPGILSGLFSVKKSRIQEYQIERPHKALIISLTSEFHCETRNLVGGALTFPDDVYTSGESVMGYFTIQMDTLLNMQFERTAFVTVSYGELLSYTLRFEPAPAT